MKDHFTPFAKHFRQKYFTQLTHHLTLWHQVLRDHSILDCARNRIVVGIMGFACAFILIALRLMDVMIFNNSHDRHQLYQDINHDLVLERADIVDRNGAILATHLSTASVYANPKVILNPKDTAAQLASLMPDLDRKILYERLTSGKGFVWIKRHIAPKVQQEIHKMGLPGVYLEHDQKRVYPYGSIVSHIVGYCGIDNIGLGGVERYFDEKLRQSQEPLQLALDVRAQYVMHRVLSDAVSEFRARGGNAILVDLKTGQVIGMISLPDFDPNQMNDHPKDAIFNRNVSGVFEPGSTFKAFNTAIALETKKIHLSTVYDARQPIKIGRFTISDWKLKPGFFTVTEALMQSSNIASAKMALEFGRPFQEEYFKRFGFYTKPTIELKEVAAPIINPNRSDATLISNAFGYAISVSPLQTVQAMAAVLNNGVFRNLTLLKQNAPVVGTPVISQQTAQDIRSIMYRVVEEGTARKAQVEGYKNKILGKTGSAHIVRGKKYDKTDKTTSFIGSFGDYLLLVMLDSPKPTKDTYGYSTGGWNACPTAGKMIKQLAPLLGVAPDHATDHHTSSIKHHPHFKKTAHYREG